MTTSTALSGSASRGTTDVTVSQRLANFDTPTKQRDKYKTFTHNSVDKSIKKELERHRHSGIPISEFLKLSFFLSDDQMKEYTDLVKRVHAHTSNEYQVVRDEFAQMAARDERGMYQPFAKMANMILDQHRHNSTHRIKALPFSGSDYIKTSRFADRKPDVLLVPEKDGETEITVKNIHWRQTLLSMEFKKGSGGRKRSGEDASTINFAPPFKRPSTNSTRETVAQPTSSHGTGCAPDTTGPATDRPGSSSRRRNSKVASVSRISSRSARLPGILDSVVPEHGEVTAPMGPPGPPARFTPTEVTDSANDIVPLVGGEDDDGIIRRTRDVPIQVPPSQASNLTMRTSARSDIKWEVQLANYVTEVMSDLSDRTYAFGALIQETKMQLTYNSRSVYVISDEFDIVEDPITFSILLLLFAKEPLEKLGFNSDMGYRNPFNSSPLKVLNVGLNAIDRGGDNFKLDPGTQLTLGECIHSEYCLTGRATSVYNVVRPKNCEVDLVVKFSWQVKQRRREDIAIRIARHVETEHSPEIYGVGFAPEKSPSKSLIEKCSVRPPSPTEERELRVLLMRKYRPVEELDSEQYYEVAQQLVLYVHKLYSKAELLHRDISIFNMVYYMKGEDIVGVLIDFDLAIYPIEMAYLVLGITPAGESDKNDSNSSASDEVPTNASTTVNTAGNSGVNTILNIYPLGGCQDRSGTTPFMAIETLDLSTSGYKHHLCHDLESILYASVWHGVGYKYATKDYPKAVIDTPEGSKETDLLRPWRVGTWRSVMKEKEIFLKQPHEILEFIDHPILAKTCERLAEQFDGRRSAVKEASRNRKRMEGDLAVLKALTTSGDGHTKKLANKSKKALEQWKARSAEAQLGPVAPVPLSPIFPEYAVNWLIESDLDDCQKSCCRI